MHLTKCFCKVGSVSYPGDRTNISFGTNNINAAYKEFVKFNRKNNGLLDSIEPYKNHETF